LLNKYTQITWVIIVINYKIVPFIKIVINEKQENAIASHQLVFINMNL